MHTGFMLVLMILMRMAGFFTLLSGLHLPILQGNYLKVMRPAQVHADGFTVIGRNSNFCHNLSLFVLLKKQRSNYGIERFGRKHPHLDALHLAISPEDN
jgi:hypothetical protein